MIHDLSSVLSDVSCQLFNIHICYRCFKLSAVLCDLLANMEILDASQFKHSSFGYSMIQLSLQPELPE